MSSSSPTAEPDELARPELWSGRMPAEWARHAACLMLYPHNAHNLVLDRAQRAVRQVARAIAGPGQEHVILYALNEEQAEELRQDLLREQQAEKNSLPFQPPTHDDDDDVLHNMTVAVLPSEDTWARDTGPTFVLSQDPIADRQPPLYALIGLDWQFNAYGGPEHGAYWPCPLDQQLARGMCQHVARLWPDWPVHTRSIPLVLEGGSIHTDGQGTLLTTQECLLQGHRNPDKSAPEIEHGLLQATGCTRLIWLEKGLAYDEDTNGHIDNWACWIRPGQVVLAWTDLEQDDPENYQRCRAAWTTLQGQVDAQGRSLTVHQLHLPRPLYYTAEDLQGMAAMDHPDAPDTTLREAPTRTVGQRLAGSYINFYLANAAVIVPQFGDEIYDARALDTLQALFPERAVVGVPSRDILVGGGNIHCITQQVPHPQPTLPDVED